MRVSLSRPLCSAVGLRERREREEREEPAKGREAKEWQEARERKRNRPLLLLLLLLLLLPHSSLCSRLSCCCTHDCDCTRGARDRERERWAHEDSDSAFSRLSLSPSILPFLLLSTGAASRCSALVVVPHNQIEQRADRLSPLTEKKEKTEGERRVAGMQRQ